MAGARKAPAHDRKVVTVQQLRKAPGRVQTAWRALGKPLSKTTAHDWFNIACQFAPLGVFESAFVLPPEFSVMPPKAAPDGPKQRGRKQRYTADMKRTFLGCLDLAEHRIDSYGKRRTDADTIRFILRKQTPFISDSKLQGEVRRLGAIASRFRKDLSRAAR